MKLYDRIDEEVEKKEAGSPLCILLSILLFITVASGLTLLNFNRSTAKFLELQAEDLENKLKLYEEMTQDIHQLETRQSQVYIPSLLKKRYVVACENVKNKGNPSTKLIEFTHNFDDMTAVKAFLNRVERVHMVTYKDTLIKTFPKLYLDFQNKWVDYNMEIKQGNSGGFTGTFKSKNLEDIEYQICALVSGTEKGK